MSCRLGGAAIATGNRGHAMFNKKLMCITLLFPISIVSAAETVVNKNAASTVTSKSVSPAETRAIGKEAYIFGTRMVDTYKTMYACMRSP
jgi:hypothetical protein